MNLEKRILLELKNKGLERYLDDIFQEVALMYSFAACDGQYLHDSVIDAIRSVLGDTRAEKRRKIEIPPDCEPTSFYEKVSEDNWLDDLIKKLQSREDRIVVVLKVVFGFKNVEIAEVLGVNSSMISYRFKKIGKVMTCRIKKIKRRKIIKMKEFLILNNTTNKYKRR